MPVDQTADANLQTNDSWTGSTQDTLSSRDPAIPGGPALPGDIANVFAPRNISTVRDLDEIAYSAGDLLNTGGVAEGSNQPPAQHGDFRVPVPSGFHVISIQSNTGTGDIFTLGWNDVVDSTEQLNQTQITLYRIYVQQAYNSNMQPSLVGTATASPCSLHVVSDRVTAITFWIQPVCSNGLFLPLSRCPTCTASSTGASYVFSVPPVTVSIAANLPGPGGSTYTGIQVTSSATGDIAAILTNGFEVINHNGKIAVGMTLTAPGALPGLVAIFDGSGSGGTSGGRRISATGTNGQIIHQRVNAATNSLISLREDGSAAQADYYPDHIEIGGSQVLQSRITGRVNYTHAQNRNANYDPTVVTLATLAAIVGTLVNDTFTQGSIGV